MKTLILFLSLLSLSLFNLSSYSHEFNPNLSNSDSSISVPNGAASTTASGYVHYLGNEGLMVVNDQTKILFDPFFHNSYGHYTLVPENIRSAIFLDQPPYDNIQAIFISHAHEDHFDKNDVLNYLLEHKNVKLIAPLQAIKLLEPLTGFEKIKAQIFSINLQKGDMPQQITINNISVEAVRIPHAGWPQRAEVENIVYRVNLNQKMVVMHMGDADPNLHHFYQQKLFWPKKVTDVAFPPYWFSLSDVGRKLQENVINAKKIINLHVPTNVPEELKLSGQDYFYSPGIKREIRTGSNEQ